MKARDAKEFERVRKSAQSALAKRKPWEPEWQRIADALLPYNVQIAGRRDLNKAARKDHDIVDDSPVRALDNLAAGLMARITSPARKWFGMQVTSNGSSVTDLDSDARGYLDQVAEIIASDLQRGGWYAVLALSTYLDMGGFGTAAIFMDEQPDGGVVFDSVPIGRFAIDTDHLGRVNTWVREWSATAQQLLKRFGEASIPQKVKDCIARQDTTTEFPIMHAVLPLDKPTAVGHAFSSTWWILGDTDDVLHEGGFFEFPALVPRWTVRPGDVYGRGPGWKALGNIRMLQHFTRALVALQDRMTDPPKWMAGGGKLSYLPGTVTHIDVQPGSQVQMGNVVDVRSDAITVARETIEGLRQAIDETFFGHLWRAFTDDDRTGRTATEIEARRQELALLTGPLLESLNGELLEPCIERRYKMLMRRGVLPPLPESLQGAEMRVEFISIMHQMQQSTTLLGLRSFLADVQNLASVRPEAIDSLNTDAIVDDMARASGVSSDTLVSKDELQQVRQQKAQAEMQAQQAEQAKQFTEGVRNVSGADPQKLSDLAATLAPAAAAQGGALAPVN